MKHIINQIKSYFEQRCRKCGKRYDGDKHGLQCPYCGHINW